MAEIKSTMDMVMERAARMAAGSDFRPDEDDLIKTGMRLAAEFLSRKAAEPVAVLKEQEAAKQTAIRKGMLETLLRNVTLPRDENLKATGSLALQGLLGLGGSSPISAICAELQQILEQYNQHKEQTTQQLDDAIRAQLEQQMARRGGQAAKGSLNPALHPQYKEEIARMLGDLNAQYTQALDQRKDMIRQYMAKLP